MSIAAARKLCRQFDIKFVGYFVRCDEGETWCAATIARLLSKYGEAPMVLTLRVFAETNPNNRDLLDREIITAVHAVCRSKRWSGLGLPFLEAWDNINLSELHKDAVSFGLWRLPRNKRHPLWTTLATLITIRLERALKTAGCNIGAKPTVRRGN